MALSLESDLEVEKLLIWKTELPFEHKPRQSSYFSLMGLEWCLRFTYSTPAFSSYHMITLHRVIDGRVLPYTGQERQARLKTGFSVKTYLMHPTIHGSDEIGAKNKKFEYPSSWIWFGGENKDDIFKSLPCLYDRCEVKVVCKFFDHPQSTFRLEIGTDSIDDVQVSSEASPDIESLSSDFSLLLEKEILPDVKLECGDQMFQAHRCILAARSKVFQAMFHNKMLESKTGAVKIQDMDVGVLKKLVKFLYSGKPNDLSEDCTADLYEAADKYDVLSLKSACAYWIVRNLTLENCVKYLKLADFHSDCDLKAGLISFIIKKPNVFKRPEWLTYLKEHSVSAAEVLQAYATSTV